MSAKTFTAQFAPRDRVVLVEVNRPGRVEEVSFTTGQTAFKVSYWDDGERKTVWVYVDEIVAA